MCRRGYVEAEQRGAQVNLQGQCPVHGSRESQTKGGKSKDVSESGHQVGAKDVEGGMEGGAIRAMWSQRAVKAVSRRCSWRRAAAPPESLGCAHRGPRPGGRVLQPHPQHQPAAHTR